MKFSADPRIYIYIYIYTHFQSKVFGHPKKFLFLILNVLFLMRQVKVHNGIIYFTKYTSSWAALNKNLPPPKKRQNKKQTKKNKKLKIFLKISIHQNYSLWPLSLLYWFSAFFPPKMSKVARGWAALVGCLALTFSVNFIPHKLNGILVCWLCRPRHQLKDVLFLFTFNVLLAGFIWMLGVIILHEYNPWPISNVPDVAVCFDSQSDSICPSSGSNIRLCNWQELHHLNNRAFMLYGWSNTGDCSSFTSSSLYIDTPIWPKDSNFDLSVQRTLFYFSIVQSLYALTHWSILTLFCFLNSGSWLQFSHIGHLHSLILTVDGDIFQWHWFSCTVMFGAVSLLSSKLVTLMKLSSA